MHSFSKLENVIQQGISRHLHTGVQVYISIDRESVLNQGFGLAAPDQPMTSDMVMLWRSAGKPLTATAVCRLWEQGHLDLDAPLSDLLPKARRKPFQDITVRQILTHTSGLPVQESGWPHLGWDQIIDAALSVEQLVTTAAYQPQTTWFLLGELLQQLDASQRSFLTIVEQDLLTPLLSADEQASFLPLSNDQPHAEIYVRNAGKLVSSSYTASPWLSSPSPGGNLRGPVSVLGRFYEMLLHDGLTRDGQRLLQPNTAHQMTARHRAGLFDQTFQHIVDFGLGLIVDSNSYGVETVPYGFSPHCSPRTFGHGGAQCAMGFCDPERRLVVVWAANGFCGEGQHQRRNSAINAAIYEDLELV